MKGVLLVLTTGQTDVQVVKGQVRHEIDKRKCGDIHAELERRSRDWTVVDAPFKDKDGESVAGLPAGSFELCTPKLDALLADAARRSLAVSDVLILETRRQHWRDDPHYAGTVIERRLADLLPAARVVRSAYLREDDRQYEDRRDPRDAVVRRDVVSRIVDAVRECLLHTAPEHVIVATTGGMPVFSHLVDEIVGLHTAGTVELLDVPDGSKAEPPGPDQAVPRTVTPEPAESFRARRNAVSLLEKGNPLGAWGAARHLDRVPSEREWTKVLEWVASFASSLPLSDNCDIPILRHSRMAVRAGIRVELALRRDDIPAAVHGTVAFFESALWDHLGPRLTRYNHPDRSRRLYRANPEPSVDLFRRWDGSKDDKGRPFEPVSVDGLNLFKVYDDDVSSIRLAEGYLNLEKLAALGKVASRIRDLRNDVAHNEPTPELLATAKKRMVDVGLWSDDDRFLAQPLVADTLRELGVEQPADLCNSLLESVKSRLRNA